MELMAIIEYETPDDKAKARLIEEGIRGQFQRIRETLEDSDVDYALLITEGDNFDQLLD